MSRGAIRRLLSGIGPTGLRGRHDVGVRVLVGGAGVFQCWDTFLCPLTAQSVRVCHAQPLQTTDAPVLFP